MINLCFNYLLESSICLLFFALAYKLLLSNLTHFSWTRFYLLASVVLSLILPVIILPIQWHSHLTSIEPFANTYLLHINQPDAINNGNPQLNPIQAHTGVNVQMVLLYGFFLAYIIGLTYNVFGFAWNLKTIHQFIKQNPKEKENNYWIIHLKNEMPAFSFFNFIFINDNYKSLNKKDLQMIKNHEIVHVKQNHTLDILFLELVSIVFWFNPVMKYLKKSLQEVHEYIVDEKIAGHGEQKKAYAQLLLNLASEAKTFNLAASITGEHIKRRILMVARPKTLPGYKLLFIVLVPLTAMMLLSFSYVKNPGSQEKAKLKSKPQVTSGNRIGEITWVGNTVFSVDTLNMLLGYKKGDYFSFSDLNRRMSSGDISTLYYDNGYVYFKADFSANHKINVDFDITITIYEGPITRIGSITIEGNETIPFNEISKNIQIKEGELFNKTKILNSLRAIAAMNKFVPEKIEPVPIPNPEKFTKDYAVVDLVFKVTEIKKSKYNGRINESRRTYYDDILEA